MWFSSHADGLAYDLGAEQSAAFYALLESISERDIRHLNEGLSTLIEKVSEAALDGLVPESGEDVAAPSDALSSMPQWDGSVERFLDELEQQVDPKWLLEVLLGLSREMAYATERSATLRRIWRRRQRWLARR